MVFRASKGGRLFARQAAQIPGGETTSTFNAIQESYLFFLDLLFFSFFFFFAKREGYGPRNRQKKSNFGDVSDSSGMLTFDLPQIKAKGLRSQSNLVR